MISVKAALAIFLLLSSFMINAQTYIRLPEANKHIGETVRVSGRIVDAKDSQSSMNDSTTVLTLGNDCPDQTLVMAISEVAKRAMNYKPEDSLVGKQILATGKLEEISGKTQLVIAAANDLEIINDDYNKTFTKVEQPPLYPGGVDQWLAFLNENLDKTVAKKNGTAVGKSAVKVQFLLDTEGNVSNVEAIEVPKKCLACGAEAVRVVRKSGRWIPAMQNCQKVVFQAVEYIHFD